VTASYIDIISSGSISTVWLLTCIVQEVYSRSIEGIEPFIVGCSPDLVIQMQLLDDSFQMTNLAYLAVETRMRWPDIIANMRNVNEK